MSGNKRKGLLVNFNNDDWPLATLLEILNNSLTAGENLEWFNAVGLLKYGQEFPIAGRVDGIQHSRRLKKSKIFSKLNLNLITPQEVLGNQCRNLSMDDVQKVPGLKELSSEVAYLELISRRRESFPCKIHNQKELSTLTKLFSATFLYFKEYLENQNYNMVFIYNGRFLQERALWEVCKHLGITVVFYEKFGAGWDDRYFLFKEAVHSANYRSKTMLAFSEEMGLFENDFYENLASKWFENRKAGLSQSFTKLQLPNSGTEKFAPFVVFFHSSEDELITTDLQNSNWTDQLETVRKLSEFFTKRGIETLVIRLHPNLLYKSDLEINKWISSCISFEKVSKFVKVIKPSSPINSYELIENSVAVITAGSTIGVEAAYFGKKSILTGSAFHERMGIVKQIPTLENLEKELDYSNDEILRSRQNALKYAFFMDMGGTKFNSVKAERIGARIHYQLEDFKIGKSNLVKVLMRIDKLLLKYINLFHFRNEVCKDDCRNNSSKRWK